MAESTKIVLICNHGPDQVQQAALALAVALVAQASEAKAVLVFHGEGGLLLKKGTAERLHAPGYAPLKQLLEAYLEEGGRLLVCRPCLERRGLAAEELIEGSEALSSAALAQASAGATRVAVY